MVEYIQITCPSCQRTLRVRKQYAGVKVACTHCGNSFVVQQPDELEQLRSKLQTAEQQLAEQLTQAAARQREWQEKNTELERQLDEQRAAAATEADRLRGELETARQQREATQNELESLRKERDQFAERSDTADSASRETEQRLADQVQQLRQESTALRQDRDRLADEVRQAHNRNNELAAEMRSVESKLAQSITPADVPADQQQRDEMRSQILKLQAQNDELRSVIQGLGITVG